MNGVLCRRLLDHLKVVFPKIGAMAHEQVTSNHARSDPTKHKNDLDEVIDI